MLYLLLATISTSFITFFKELREIRQKERELRLKKRKKTDITRISKLSLLPICLTLILAIAAAIVQFFESRDSDLATKNIQDTNNRILGSDKPPSIIIESHPALSMYMTPKTEKSFHEDSVEFRAALRFYLVNESDNTLKNLTMFFEHGDWLEQREKVRKTSGIDPLRKVKLNSTIKTETIKFYDIESREKKHFDYNLPLDGYDEFKFKIYIEWNAGSYILNLILKPKIKFQPGLDTYESFRNNFSMELASFDFERFSTVEKPKITITRSDESWNSLITPK